MSCVVSPFLARARLSLSLFLSGFLCSIFGIRERMNSIYLVQRDIYIRMYGMEYCLSGFGVQRMLSTTRRSRTLDLFSCVLLRQRSSVLAKLLSVTWHARYRYYCLSVDGFVVVVVWGRLVRFQLMVCGRCGLCTIQCHNATDYWLEFRSCAMFRTSRACSSGSTNEQMASKKKNFFFRRSREKTICTEFASLCHVLFVCYFCKV